MNAAIRNATVRPMHPTPAPSSTSIASPRATRPNVDSFDRAMPPRWIPVTDPTLKQQLDAAADTQQGRVIVNHPDNSQTAYEIGGKTYVNVIGIGGPQLGEWFEVRQGPAVNAAAMPMPPPERRLDPRFAPATKQAFDEGRAQQVDSSTADAVRRDGVWAGHQLMELPVPLFTIDNVTDVTFLVHEGALYADVTQSGPTDAPMQVLYRIGQLSDL